MKGQSRPIRIGPVAETGPGVAADRYARPMLDPADTEKRLAAAMRGRVGHAAAGLQHIVDLLTGLMRDSER